MKNINEKLKNESFMRRLEQSGVQVNSLKESLKEKEKESKIVEK